MRALTRYFEKRKQAGFTLIEMLTSIAIIGIITAVVIQNQNKFASDLELTNVAYRVALQARQAQVFGIGVRQVGQVNNFTAPYGLHFVANAQDSTILFADTNGDGKYTSTDSNDAVCAGEECIEQLKLGRGNKFAGYCALRFTQGGELFCSARSFVPIEYPDLPLYAMDIIFKRPKTDAKINFYENNYIEQASNSRCSATCDGVAICLESREGKKKRVVVLVTGQISVENVTDTAAAGGNVCI